MTRTVIGRGIYTPKQVARLVNLRLDSDFGEDQIDRWARGYHRAGRDYAPVIVPELDGDRRLVTFLDFVELFFVGFFRHQGLSLQVIRAAAREGGKLFSTDHPFAVKSFRTDGQSIFAELERTRAASIGLPAERLIEELHIAQMVFPDMVEPYFEDIDWGDVEAEAYWPCGHDGRIVLDPTRSFGQPIDDLTGVPTEALYSFVTAGDDPEMVADWYGIPLAAVEAAVEFEHALRSA
ncbi:MAG: DUF433 domain-containing protein [Armatimonadota bacterium]|nr:DUF433 domain-containing protein [Armatimonadota bacterium]